MSLGGVLEPDAPGCAAAVWQIEASVGRGVPGLSWGVSLMRAVLAHDAQAETRARRHRVVRIPGNRAWSDILICLAGTPGVWVSISVFLARKTLPNINTGKAMGVKNRLMQNGTQVVQWDYDGTANQFWCW